MSTHSSSTNIITHHPHPSILHLHGAESSPPSAVTAPASTDSADQATATGSSTQPTASKTPSTLSRHLPYPHAPSADIELQRRPAYTAETDPFALSAALKSPAELSNLRAGTNRKRDGCGPLTLNQQSAKTRKLQKFYADQNENIERLLKPVDEHVRTAKELEGENHLKFQIAVQGSFVANLGLAVLQVYGAVTSGSLSLFTTMADALFDPMSNITLMVAHRAVKKVDGHKFPSGKARIETAGNIVFCFLMTSVSFILIVLSVMELADGAPKGGDRKNFHLPSIIAVSVAFATKLVLFCYCWALRNVYSQIRILWEDHRNDLFINGFGILTSVGGSRLKWWIDPMGAIILSLLISILWLKTAYSEFQLLVGISAETEMQQWITYISMTHSPMITAIDTVRAYHSGPRIIVEVDVVVDANETLRAAHDVAEELQMKLESLPNVERAYVHIDYETSHKPEHFLKKEL